MSAGAAPATFDAVTAPLGADRFLDEVLGRRPLHLEGPPDKWHAVMNWGVLNRLLGMTTVWSHGSLMLFLDKEPLPYAAYASPAPGRDGGQVLRPEPARVKQHLARGATLVLNDIDQLTPELAALSRVMEEALGAKLQANLYLSSKRRQGFKVHYDTHDVFAVHTMGEKTWMVFEGRARDPIAHPAFKELPPEHHEKAKGALWKEVRLRPGDLLYLPRGQYHYALADEGACAHIAFGATYPIGLDVAGHLFERLVHEPAARANLPRGREDLRARLAELADRASAILKDEATLRHLEAFQAGFRYPRDTYDLPELIERHEERYRLKAQGLRLVEQGGRAGLVREGSRQAVEVPPAAKRVVAWVLARPGFARSELAAAFPGEPPAALDRLLADVVRMGIVEPDLPG
jgi:bifunctional lysine-specific demethylase and histidyl-hydroxylase MINA